MTDLTRTLKRRIRAALPWAKTVTVTDSVNNRPRIQARAFSARFNPSNPWGREWPRAMFGIRATGDTVKEVLANIVLAQRAAEQARAEKRKARKSRAKGETK